MVSPLHYTITVKSASLNFHMYLAKNPYSLFDNIYGNPTSNFDGYIKAINMIQDGVQIESYFVEDCEKRLGLMEQYPDIWKEQHRTLVEAAVRTKLSDSNSEIIIRQML